MLVVRHLNVVRGVILSFLLRLDDISYTYVIISSIISLDLNTFLLFDDEDDDDDVILCVQLLRQVSKDKSK